MLGCTVALIGTMLTCTYWLEDKIERAIPSFPVYIDSLVSITHTLEKVEANTDSIDERLMPPEEQHRRLMQKLEQMKPTPR